jgi:D-serine deaminase-like pyridoxal phosphate-dependent protein
MVTEHRAGTYVYNDVMMVTSGIATFDDCALQVRTTVVSRPTEERAIIDAGSKVLTREQYYVKDFGGWWSTPRRWSPTFPRSTAWSTSPVRRRSRRSAR